jgi:hypothetical protein
MAESAENLSSLTPYANDNRRVRIIDLIMENLDAKDTVPVHMKSEEEVQDLTPAK